MAKKTKKENITTAAQSVAAKTAAKVAEQTFKRNPDIKEVHITSDGVAFYTRNDAQNHAKTLPNKEVFSTRRGSIFSVATKPTELTKELISDNGEEVITKEVDELTGESIDNEPENNE